PHKHSITGWPVTLSAFLLLVPELFGKNEICPHQPLQPALENYFSRDTDVITELMFAMCGNANYERDDDIIPPKSSRKRMKIA
ncbi:hypothetical protein AVEN_13770-1, partial [Araneus ventricosus]